MWIWDQSAGTLSRDGVVISKGYAGRERGKNNPAMQAAKSIGPIPQGDWKMTGVYNSKRVGPFAIVLEPHGHTALGRTAFRIHGDSIRNPGTASRGCIVLPRVIREKMWKSGDRDLRVIE